MNRRNPKRPGLQKEKVCMIAASVFVLSALTLTGVYMAAQNDSKNEENLIDFAKLEQHSDTEQGNLADNRFTKAKDTDLSTNDDMDVDPQYTEVNSGQVTNSSVKAQTKQENRFAQVTDEEEQSASLTQDTQPVQTTEVIEAEEESVQAQASIVTPSFSEQDTLQWPIVGEVLLNYSMDKAIYFPTMQQYRYNPSIVIAANEGERITAAADGIVKKIYKDAQTGTSILFDLGNGYELVYGQLTDIALAEGDSVKAGDLVGKVAKPTIYYSEEGSNVYFKLTKNGQPADPMSRLE